MINKCDNTIPDNNCANETEYDEWIKRASVSFIYTNQYFDANDYVQPIKSYLDDRFYWPLLKGYNKLTNIFLKKQLVELRDNYLSYIP
jgi:hypothetical protein